MEEVHKPSQDLSKKIGRAWGFSINIINQLWGVSWSI